ncbi:MAG TPA: GNAT family N-acetyltransferase [Ktedonobacterales bacterium]|jgi:predicted acetyltransferase|nr:GNAT family N-acetyltransferase [Ktedonobacterales bacterium]
MQIELSPITPDEYTAFMQANFAAFGEHPSDDALSRERLMIEFERTVAAYDGGRIVGTAGNMSMELTLPGGAHLPTAGLSWVSVLPTHRRQGILRQMMQALLEDARNHGEPIAALMASESSIYGRFGFGIATSKMDVTLDRRKATFLRSVRPSGSLRLVDHEEIFAILPNLYERSRRLRPGALSRSAGWWQSYLANPPDTRQNEGPRYNVVYESPSGDVEGAALYRIANTWEEGLASGILTVYDFYDATAKARAVLWQYLLSLDLVQTVHAVNRPLDEPLRWMLEEPRLLRTSRVTDNLWLNLLDVSAALAARRYAASDRLIFEVTDAFWAGSAGRNELVASPEGAECKRTTAEPDLALDAAALGAAYLGGVHFTTLADAGRIFERTPGACRRADAIFDTGVVPYCATPF